MKSIVTGENMGDWKIKKEKKVTKANEQQRRQIQVMKMKQKELGEKWAKRQQLMKGRSFQKMGPFKPCKSIKDGIKNHTSYSSL